MRLAIVAALCTVSLGAGPGLGRAIELPAKAQELRDQGVPAAEVAGAIRAARDHGLTASDTADLLDSARGAKLDDLGAFVREKLDEGLRGRELAEAIHEEQARRGQGRPDDPGRGAKGKGPEGGHPHDDGEKGGKGKSGKGGR